MHVLEEKAPSICERSQTKISLAVIAADSPLK
jgi:hypothetical protein